MRKYTSKSFGYRLNTPTILPPLTIDLNANKESQKQGSATTRPGVFIIRKKNQSYIDPTTVRDEKAKRDNITTPTVGKLEDGQKNLEGGNQERFRLGFRKKNASNKRQENKFKADQTPNSQYYPVVLTAHKNGNINNKQNEQQNNLINLTVDREARSLHNEYFKNKVLIKRKPNRKKVEQCKIRKINWGSKNEAFQLEISAIQESWESRPSIPTQSMKQLYGQIPNMI